jgi:DNA-directed RNA polymerase specialized sigma24 family protein
MRNKEQDKFFDAFARLTDAERLLLEVYAERRIGGTPYTSGMDILHEVIGKVLAGERRWPPDLDLAFFLAGCVRSVANNSRTRAETSNVAIDELGEEDEWRCSRPRYEAVASSEDVAILNERKELSHKAVKFVKATLGPDHEALQVLEGMMAGLDPKDMCAAFDMEFLVFKAARQRVANRLKIFAQRNPQ